MDARARRGKAGRVAGLLLLAIALLPFLAVPGSSAWAGAAVQGSRLASEHRLLSAGERYAAAASRPDGEMFARHRLGQLLLRRGQWQEAIRELKLAEVGGSIGRQTLSDLAFAQHKSGDQAASLATLRRLLALRPEDPEAWINLVSAAAESGLSPEQARLLLSGAVIPTAGGQTAQRVAYLEAACLLGANTRAGQVSLGKAIAGPDPGTARLARILLDAAVLPSAPQAALALAGALVSQGLIGPALSELEIEQKGSAEARRLALLGHSRFEAGMFAEAEGALRRALEIDPALEMSRDLLASLLRVKGDPEGALAILDADARRGALGAAGYLELGYAFADLGDYGSAEQALRRAAEADPDDGELRLAVADFHVTRQYRVGQALGDAEEAVRLLGRTPAALGVLGWGLHLAGRSEEALFALSEAVGKAPESPLLRYRLGSAYEGLGRKAEARQQYIMVKELDGTGDVWNRAKAALDDL